MRKIQGFILVAAVAAVIGYIGWTVYGEGAQSASAGMAESFRMAEQQSESVGQTLTSVSQVGNSPDSSARKIDSGGVAEVTNLNALLVEWRPRYQAARRAHTKFDAAIANAKSRAATYFAQQQAITESMHDPANRKKAEQQDEAEVLLYRQWEARADAALRETTELIYQLGDMDANLRKMELRADFVFDTSAFLEVPDAVAELNSQLADFQTSSENIRAVSGSPFGG